MTNEFAQGNALGVTPPADFDPIAYMNDPRWVGSVYGLERIEELLERLGNPQNQLRYVHVVGTNGKGSVCAYISCALKECGYRVGRFTSPAVETVNECIVVDGEMISDAEFAACMYQVAACADAMEQHPSAFELQCAAALLFFAQRNCNIVVLEAGLGGKQDATNVIAAPEVCVIVRIGLDHLGLLGSTEAEIAREKAGIIKPGCTVVSWQQESQGAMDAIEAAAEAADAPLNVVDAQAIDLGKCYDGIRVFSYKGVRYETRMTAAYQPMNAAIAIEALSALRERGWLIDAHMRDGIALAALPGRFEIQHYGEGAQACTVVFDGAHNEQGASALAASLDGVFPDRKPVLVTGILADKDYTGMLRLLAPRASSLVCVTPPNSRALPAEDLAATARQFLSEDAGLFVAESYEQAVERAVETASFGTRLICVCGSLYQISKARRAVAAVFNRVRLADEDACAKAAEEAAARISERRFRGAFEGFELFDGDNPVMISAPHAVAVERKGEMKPIEPFTGTLAYLMADSLGCPTIVKTADCGEDPNDDEESRYRDTLCAFVQLHGVAALLDLHQMNPTREHDVMIGTGEGRNIFGREDLLACIVDAFEAHGFDAVGVDEYFRALGACTVSASTARRSGIPCFQLEINSKLLLPARGENRCADLIDTLSDAIQRMGKLL